MGGFIRVPDKGLMRRLAIIEVDGFDDYRASLDVDQLWAEAIMLLDGGFNPTWTQSEYSEFVDENRQYVCESNALRLLKLHYRKPEVGERAQFMTARDIVDQLKERRKLSSVTQQVNEVTVGLALSVLDFKPRSARDKNGEPRYGYDIVPLFDQS